VTPCEYVDELCYHLKLDSLGYVFVADCIGLCLSPFCLAWWAAQFDRSRQKFL